MRARPTARSRANHRAGAPALVASLWLTVGLLAGCGDKTDGGAGQKTAGHIESAAGEVTGSDHLKREGKKDEVVGGVKSTAHDLKDAVHDATH